MRFRFHLGLVLLFTMTACSTITSDTRIDELETQVAQQKSTLSAMETISSFGGGGDGSMATQNAVMADQMAYMQATIAALSGGGGGNFVPQPTPMVSNAGGGVGQQTQSAVITPNAGGIPSAGGGAPGGVTPGAQSTPLTDTTNTAFTQTTTAMGILQADGCPADRTAVFDTTEDEIFVVTTITNLKAGAVLGARWTANGTVFASDDACWVPGEDWAQVCAYCSIVNETGSFEAGSWTVELTLDSQLMSQAQFQIAAPAQ
ncbi:MAG TPA: hypothetical protein VHP83_11330 [Aggregatilineaceae bacterium]|nr:hypothetical protein [Aggregatilineaceae bacterium]